MNKKTLTSLAITFVILFIAFGFAVVIVTYIHDYHKPKHPQAIEIYPG